ncbi:MAG: LysR family transcriptional regulator [Lachnospiraceae bacterium]|nr:LysR family transcriptional regulator [Lachnospiraceae bacterium]
MNFQNLEYFLVTTEEKNITRAAERLHMSQQALSGHIIRLEEEVGCPLFERKPSLTLTYAGECFREQAQQMVNLKYQSESMMRDIRANEKGQLRIGISYSRGQALLPRVLPEYSAAHPLVDLSIVEDNAPELQVKILQGSLDVIVGFLPFTSPELDSRPLFDEHFYLVLPKALLRETYGDQAAERKAAFAKSGDLKLFAELPFVLLRKGEHIRKKIDAELRNQHLTLNVRIETSNTQTALALASAGMGATIVHEILLKSSYTLGGLSSPETREKVEIIPFKEETLCDTIGIGFHKERYMPKITKDFIQLCQKKLGGLKFEEA